MSLIPSTWSSSHLLPARNWVASSAQNISAHLFLGSSLRYILLSIVIHTFNPCTWEVKTRGSGAQGHSWLHSKFKATGDFDSTNDTHLMLLNMIWLTCMNLESKIYSFISSSWQPYGIGTCVVPNLQIRNRKCRDIKLLVQDRMVSKLEDLRLCLGLFPDTTTLYILRNVSLGNFVIV